MIRRTRDSTGIRSRITTDSGTLPATDSSLQTAQMCLRATSSSRVSGVVSNFLVRESWGIELIVRCADEAVSIHPDGPIRPI